MFGCRTMLVRAQWRGFAMIPRPIPIPIVVHFIVEVIIYVLITFLMVIVVLRVCAHARARCVLLTHAHVWPESGLCTRASTAPS